MKKIKVLQICNHFWPCIGGIENYVGGIVKKIDKKRFHTDVLCLNKCRASKNKLKKFEVFNDIKIFRIPFIDLIFYKIAPHVFLFLKRYDILHIHGIGFFSDIVLITKPLHKKKVLISTHGGMFHTKRLMFLKKIYFNLWLKFILRFSDKIITESENNRELFSRICKPVFIPCAIEIEFFSKVNRKSENINNLLFVGRLSRNKRIEKLIEMLFWLKKRNKKTKLHIACSDWKDLGEKLKKITRKLGVEKDVIFYKDCSKKDLLKLYSKCKFFVSASSYEGFGISVIEAMASGCIVIVNNIDAFRKFIKDKENGFIVNFSNPKKAAEKIYEISKMKDVYIENVRKNGIETAKKFDWNTIIKYIEKNYI